MRGIIFLAAAGSLSLVAGVAAAQSAASKPAEPSVEAYLCTFAGKCGDTATVAAPAVTRDAPATKGFSLARPAPQAAAATPTTAAPATKGFSLARSAPVKTEAAPATKGFSLAARPAPTRTVVASNASAPQRAAAPVRRRAAVTPVAAAAAPAPVEQAMGAGLRRSADLMVTFESGSDKMTGAGLSKARVFAESLLRPELIDKRFVISGHTDAAGARSANVELSRRRAQAVADYLTSAGVDGSRIEVRGFGADSPLPGHRSSDAANRRVEAELVS